MNNIDITFFTPNILTVISIVVAFAAFYYTRGSYLLTLQQFKKEKNRREKATEYFEKYINRAPSYKINTFLKKLDSDELTENVAIPSEFTDFFIKKFPDQLYYFLSLLKNNQKHFVIVNEKNREELISKIKLPRTKSFLFLFAYFILGMLNVGLLEFYQNYLPHIQPELRTTMIVFLAILCILTTFFAFLSLIQATRYLYISKILKELNKNQVKQYNFSSKSLLKKYNPLRTRRKKKNTNVCQLCEKPAPFRDKNSSPYFEIYSIKKLSPSETDTVEKTILLCPNCYNKMDIINTAAN
ncbi:hypothetical protein [Acinetobacter sp. GG2]|uniref:hypothetical protein n=1 Tax=Acinetobacter sp. GG2 TaxID=651305 RepID=UPI0002E84544|nr:hypothetical protein [Acinetobacter sp. GG2]